MKLIVISGVSGSGKSTALNVLEDLDYYCIDNLPVGLLPAFAEQMQEAPTSVENIAVGIDARNLPAELHRFAYILGQLINKGIICEKPAQGMPRKKSIRLGMILVFNPRD